MDTSKSKRGRDVAHATALSNAESVTESIGGTRPREGRQRAIHARGAGCTQCGRAGGEKLAYLDVYSAARLQTHPCSSKTKRYPADHLPRPTA